MLFFIREGLSVKGTTVLSAVPVELNKYTNYSILALSKNLKLLKVIFNEMEILGFDHSFNINWAHFS